MSGGLLVNALLREVGRRVSPEEVTRMQQRHAAAYLRQFDQVRPLPGAPELLRALASGGVPHAIATSSRSDSGPALRLLGVGAACGHPEQVEHAKPDPTLIAAAARLGAHPRGDCRGGQCLDLLAARRARALGVGLLSGGYGQEELERAGAYRVYQDPADLLRHLDELGIRGVEASLAPHERPGEMGERPRDASGGGPRHEGA